ncbi:hypothetical protein O0I10_012091 [Lichtheimia ornata]|uniref:Uncharacterized protein n=1 Tax=Lichtheimia ornata TaxID=688661 RepID=A0AAD7URM1_9FUNG|nr:uncharacterized protein O0I10_012091 [Lichtheimia ornata]KAJ8652278.1 hypothetical protein O0I10_012091 [Lichtheimia ornata]
MPYFWLFATVAAFASGPLCPFVLLFACILQLLIAFPVLSASLFCLFMFFVFFHDPLVAFWHSLVDVWVWCSSDWDPRILQAMRDNEEATKFVMEARAFWKVVDLTGAPLYDVADIEGPAADEIVSACGDESVFGVAPVFGDVSFAPVVSRSGFSALGVASAFVGVDGVRSSGVDGVRSSGVDGVRGSVVGDGVSFPAVAATAYDDVEALGAGAADVGRVLDPVPGGENVVAALGVREEDVMDELAFLFLHLSVDDPLDEDTYMAPPFDRRYVEPVDIMELDDHLLSVMSVHLENSPFFQDDDDPIMIDMPSPLIPSRPATPPPSPPPSPTPIPMEVDLTIVSPTVNTTASTTTITNTATITTPMPTDTPATTTTTTDITPATTTTATAIVTSPPPSPPLNPAMSLIWSRIQQLRTRTTPSSNSATPSSTVTMPTTHSAATTSSRPLINDNMPPPPSRSRRITLTVTPPTTSSSTATSTRSSSIVRPDMPPPPPRPPRATATPSSSSRVSSSSSSSSSSTTATTSTPSESEQPQQQQQPTTITSATPQPSLPSDVREAQEALGLFD